MKTVITFCFLILNFLLFPQKILDLHYRSLLGKEKQFQFYNNSEFSYRLRGKLFYHKKRITNMNDSILIFSDDKVVKLADIKSIRIPGMRLSQWFFVAGVLFLAGDSFNNLINNDVPIVKERAVNVSAYCILGGIIMQYFQDKHIRIKRNSELKVIELDFQHVNGLPN